MFHLNKINNSIISYWQKRMLRRKKLREIKRSIFLGRYHVDPALLVEKMEKKQVFDDLDVDLRPD